MEILFITKVKILVFITWSCMFPQLCWLSNLKQLSYFEHTIQIHSKTYHFGICSWNYTEPHITQKKICFLWFHDHINMVFSNIQDWFLIDLESLIFFNKYMQQNDCSNFQDYIKNRHTLWGEEEESIEIWQFPIKFIWNYLT